MALNLSGSILTINTGESGLNRLHRYPHARVSGGEGVHVGEDEIAGAVGVKGGFVFLGQAVEVEVERVEARAQMNVM